MITLFPTYMLGDLRLTSYPYAVEFGGDHGAPETVTELVQSLLADGDIVRVARHGNREISFVVHVEGASLAEVAQNEAALRRECAKLRNLLTFEPGDEMGAPASVFEVHVAEMRQPRDDEMEQHLLRRWEITLTCAPHARSADLTTVSALEAGSTATVVDSCDSAAGWTGGRDGVPGTASTFWEEGSVGIAELDNMVTSPETWSLTRTGVVDNSSTPYLVVEVRTISSDYGQTVNFNGYATSAAGGTVLLPKLSMRRISGSVYFEVVFDMSNISDIASLTFFHRSTAGDPWQGVFIRSVARSNVPPGVSPRQVSRIVAVGGTERTPASIRVASENGTDNVGLTILHTSPEDGSGHSPSLRRWRVSGNTVNPDTSLLSGAWEPIHANAVQFEIPTSTIPEGAYLMCARLRSNTAGSHRVFFSGQTRLPAPNESTLMGPIDTAEPVSFPVANEWVFAPLGVMTLPTVRTTSGMVVVGIQRDESLSVTIDLDEAWLFRIDDDCALTVANIPAPNMWVDSPGLGFPVPTLWMGSSASNRVHPGSGLMAMGSHSLHPDGTAVFAATTGVPYPMVSATFNRRWHSNAAE